MGDFELYMFVMAFIIIALLVDILFLPNKQPAEKALYKK